MMNKMLWVKIGISALVIGVIIYFLINFKLGRERLNTRERITTIIAGFIANFLDTFGIGSFSTFFALRNLGDLMPDNKRYNGSIIIQALLTTLVQSLLFLQFVAIDSLTLLSCCTMIALGGILSGYLVKFVTRKFIYQVMLVTFSLTLIVVVLNQLQLIKISGGLVAVRGVKLAVLSGVMFLAGCLPAFGVGYYSIVLITIFLLGVSPALAYPIMTTASAVQLPMTAIPMIRNRNFYAQSTLWLALSGVIAVALATRVIAKINSGWLNWVLAGVLIYNLVVLAKQLFFRHKAVN